MVARQAPRSMGFPRQEYWSRLPFPSPGDLPDPGIKLLSPALAGEFFTTKSPGKSSVCISHWKNLPYTGLMALRMNPVSDCRGWKTRACGMNLDFGYFLSDQHCVSGFLPSLQGNSDRLGIWELGEMLDVLAVSPQPSFLSLKLHLANFTPPWPPEGIWLFRLWTGYNPDSIRAQKVTLGWLLSLSMSVF